MRHIEKLNEEEFRELVRKSHSEGHFSGDPHKMHSQFKLHNNSIDFKAISYVNDENKAIAFCGMDIFKTSKGQKKGMIHCQGVIKEERGKGLSVKILQDIEKELPNDVEEILSICNPISSGSHQKAGYIVTNSGRKTKTGKISQIRLKKEL